MRKITANSLIPIALICIFINSCTETQKATPIPDDEFFRIYSSQESKQCVYPLWQFLDSFKPQSAETIKDLSPSSIFGDDDQKGWNNVIETTREYLKTEGLILGLPQEISQGFRWFSGDSKTLEIYQLSLPVYYLQQEDKKIKGEINIVKTAEETFFASSLYVSVADRPEKIHQIIFYSKTETICHAEAAIKNVGELEEIRQALKLDDNDDFQTTLFPLENATEDTIACKICKGLHGFLIALTCNGIAQLAVCTTSGIVTILNLMSVPDPSDAVTSLATALCPFIVSGLCTIGVSSLLDSGFVCTIELQSIDVSPIPSVYPMKPFSDVCASDYTPCIPEGDDSMSLCMSACECGKLTLSGAACALIEDGISYKYGLEFTVLGETICEFGVEQIEDCDSYCQIHHNDFELNMLTQVCGNDNCEKPEENCASCPKDCNKEGCFCMCIAACPPEAPNCCYEGSPYMSNGQCGYCSCGYADSCDDGICAWFEQGNCEADCDCISDCNNKECGDDGCEGSCGECDSDYSCKNGKCVYVPSCGNGKCEQESGETFSNCPADCNCVPNCNNKECGDDGCGNICGECQPDKSCNNGLCVAGCIISLLGSYEILGDVDSHDVNIYVTSSIAYVSYRSWKYSGFQIINVADLTNPKLIGSYKILADEGLTRGIYVISNIAYIGTRGLQIIDVADPMNPKLIGDHEMSGIAMDVYVASGVAYVPYVSSKSLDDSGLQIIDVTDPSNPKPIGNYKKGIGNPEKVYVNSSVAYMINYAYYTGVGWKSDLQIIDVADPTNPKLMGSYEMSDEYTADFFVATDMAYIINDANLQIVSVANPTSPKLIGNYEMSDYAVAANSTIHVDSELVYVVNADLLRIINVTNPTSPKLTGGYEMPKYAMDIYVISGIAYVVDVEGSFYIINVSGCQ